jgi:NADH-quinone oxidoreductase subunit F
MPRVEKLMESIEHGKGRPGDIEDLERHTKIMGMGNTFCAFAPGAMEPLQSALKYFRHDFEEHIKNKECPWN